MTPRTKRLSALAVLVILIAFAGMIPTVGQCANSDSIAIPDHVSLSWTGNPSTTMTITWRTGAAESTGYVQYSRDRTLSKDRHSANASSSNFATDLGQTKLFTATLTGLLPSTEYTYRVGDGQYWSGAYRFTTADSNAREFKFLVFGDSQSNATGNPPYKLWRTTVQNAYKANRDAKFFVNVGDMVDTGQSGAHWNGWFAAVKGVIDAIPAMPVVGNHETTGSSDTKRPAYWNAQFHMPQNGPAGLKNQAYSYDYGQVHIVVLDSQGSEQKRYGNILKLQKEWLEADLAASKAIWKIAFFHKPAYSLKNGRDNKDVRDAFCPTLERYHVDLVFNGHDHGVGRTYPIKNGVSMRKPSEGTIYYVVGRSGTKTYDDLSKHDWNAFFYNPQDQPNYLVVEVAGTELLVKTVKQDGTLIDTFSIDK